MAPTAEVSAFAKIGEGAILCRQSIVEAGAEIGAHFHANVRSTVGHESRIGDFVTLGPHAGICGGCVIERGAQIGAGAIIKQGIKVGAGALVGMGAIVGKDVPAGAKAIGNPARIFTSPNRLAGNLGR